MAKTDYPPASFTPTMLGYTGQGAFRYWCQTALPLVYDDSLSYYELLNKVVVYLNNVIADVSATETNVESLLTAYNQLQEYVNTYFSSIDIQSEINNKLDEMASSGELTEIISPFIPELVSEWLTEHVTPTTPIVDNTLTISGAAADSKVTGDKINELKGEISDFKTSSVTSRLYKGYIDGSTLKWTSTTSNTYTYTLIPITPLTPIHVESSAGGSAQIAVLTNYSDPTSGDNASLSVESGWTSLITVGSSSAVGTFDGILPADAAFLYVYLGNRQTLSRKPAVLNIGGYDYAVSLYDNLVINFADAKATADKISDLKNEIADFKTSSISSQLHSGYINPDTLKWASTTSATFTYGIIPVTPLTPIHVVSPDGGSAVIAVLRNYSEPSTGDDALLSTNSAWSSVITVGSTSTVDTFDGTLPADAAFLYVYLGNRETLSRKPAVLSIGGYDYAISLYDNLVNNFDKTNTLTNEILSQNVNEITSPYVTHRGYIDANSGTWVVSGSFAYAIIPVTPKSIIKVVSDGTSRSAIACLTQYTEPSNGDSPAFSSNEEWSSVKFVGTSSSIGTLDSVLPDDASFLYVYLGSSSNYNRKPAVLSIGGYDYTKNIYFNIVNRTATYTKIRVMQNNVGHFNMGQSISGTDQYMTSENYTEKINNYKELYGNIKPDIIGFEEFEQTRDVYNNGVVYTTVNMEEEIYNRLYPYSQFYDGLTSAPCIKSKYAIIDYTRLNYPYSYSYEGETRTSNQRAIYAHVNVNGKIVGILVGAMPSGGDEEKMQMRIGAISEGIALMSADEYAFIICDENNAGAASSTTINNSIAEGDSLYNNVIVPNGWDSAMGSYFVWKQSWESTNTEYVAAIDNIFYKNNGNIILENMQVMQSEYPKLLSDHYPLYADFILK